MIVSDNARQLLETLRVRTMTVSVELVSDACFDANWARDHVEVTSGLPADAEFIGARLDCDLQLYLIAVVSAKYPINPRPSAPPDVCPIFRSHRVRLRKPRPVIGRLIDIFSACREASKMTAGEWLAWPGGLLQHNYLGGWASVRHLGHMGELEVFGPERALEDKQ
ncbi:MAG: hypothetical protein KGL39_41355 [Patescibacteria group bacterium]|nr:hypothetical protein [Patescibacteria group bacterium]